MSQTQPDTFSIHRNFDPTRFELIGSQTHQAAVWLASAIESHVRAKRVGNSVLLAATVHRRRILFHNLFSRFPSHYYGSS